MQITELVKAAHGNAVAKGFWDKPREDGTLIALMHSELSEALEAVRHGDPPSEHIPEFSGVAEELADLIIRVADYAGGKGIDLEAAVIAKMAFNAGRAHMHGKAF